MQISPRYEGLPIISIDGATDDQLVPVSRQRRRLEDTLSQLSEVEWASPSRCVGWSVQDVVAHLASVNQFWTASIRAGLAGKPTRLLANFDPVAVPAFLVDQTRGLSSAQALEQFVSSNASLLGILESVGAEDWAVTAEAPPGHLPIRLVASHALWDCWVHERDIAVPLGVVIPTMSDEVCSGLRYAAALSAAFGILSGHAVAGTFALQTQDPDMSIVLEIGDSAVVRDGVEVGTKSVLRGDAVELLEALSVRTPLAADVPDEWRKLLSGLATVFEGGS